MKLKEMQIICDKAQLKHGCIACPLRIHEHDGCLKNHRYDIEEKYRSYIKDKNEVMANKTMLEYKELERKYGIE